MGGTFPALPREQRWGEGGVGVTALACPCACLEFYRLHLQPVFACVWAGQLTKVKWNV